MKRIKRRYLPGTGWQASTFGIERLMSQILPDSNFAKGNDSFDPVSSMFSLLFAQEEAKRFNSFAFKTWADHSENTLELNKLKDQPITKETDLLSAWLDLQVRSAPLWTALRQPGPWDADPRKPFMLEALQFIEHALHQTSPDYLSDARLRQNLGISFTELLKAYRPRLPGHFLPEKLLIVEGPTEVILLPYFAQCLGSDISKAGIMFVSAGGANKVLKKYLHFKELVCLPIICLLDNDAQEQYTSIAHHLRGEDRLLLVHSGEIEDIIGLKPLVSLLNSYLTGLFIKSGIYPTIEEEDFSQNISRKQVLERLWRERELGKFDKVDFARFVASQEKRADLISDHGKNLIEKILDIHSH